MMLAMVYQSVLGLKMKNKYLIIPNKRIKKKAPNYDFLFPLKGYCVGFINEYPIEDIEENSYVYINRILYTKDIEKLEKELEKKKIKGIVFEDLGILEITKNKNIESILYATHAICSLNTVNALLKYVDTVVLSLDITKEEMINIINKATRPVSLYTYGPIPYMYSRRTLLKNYQKFQNKELKSQEILEEEATNKIFKMIENEYGTVCFDKLKYDGRVLLNEKKVKYHILNLDWENIDNIDDWLEEFNQNIKKEDTIEGFLNQKTIYRLPPRKE